MQRSDGEYLILKADEDMDVDGFQLFLRIDGLQEIIQSVHCSGFKEFDYNIQYDEIALVGYQSQPTSLKKGDQIVAIKLNSPLIFTIVHFLLVVIQKFIQMMNHLKLFCHLKMIQTKISQLLY